MAKDFFVERPSSGNPRARRGRCDGPKVVGFSHDERALNAPYRERGKGTCRAMKPKIGNDWDELANRSMSTRHALILTEMKSVSFCFSAGFCVSRACQSFFFLLRHILWQSNFVQNMAYRITWQLAQRKVLQDIESCGEPRT